MSKKPHVILNARQRRRRPYLQTLAARNAIVFRFPIRWCSLVALLRTWTDEAYGFGWAYGSDSTRLAAVRNERMQSVFLSRKRPSTCRLSYLGK